MHKIKVFEVGSGDKEVKESDLYSDEVLEKRVNAWLKRKKSIEIHGMFQSMAMSQSGIYGGHSIILTIWYSERKGGSK